MGFIHNMVRYGLCAISLHMHVDTNISIAHNVPEESFEYDDDLCRSTRRTASRMDCIAPVCLKNCGYKYNPQVIMFNC